MSVTRRQMLGTTALTGMGVLAASAGRTASAATPSAAAVPARPMTGSEHEQDDHDEHDEHDGERRYRGPLFPPLAHRAGDLLALPEGFS